MYMSKEKKFTPVIFSIVLFSLLSFLVVKKVTWFTNLDSWIYQFNWKPNETLTSLVNLFAKTTTIVPIFIVSLIVSFVLWRNQHKALAIWMSSNVLIVSAFGFILKHLVARTRPNVEQLAEKTSYSFPSGHSLLAMCLACSVILVIHTFSPKKTKNYNGLKGLLLLYVLLIGFSRIYLRVHYPSDIIAGFLLSFIWVNFSYTCLQRVYLNKKLATSETKKRFIQRTILTALTFLLVVVAGASVYGASVFKNVQKTADKIYQPLNRKTKSAQLGKSEPASFLLLGIANDSKRKTDFRANTIMVVTVNNQLKKTTITSIPRDAYVEIIGKDGMYDKINHAHSFGGDEMMIDTVEHYLDIPINHYFVINMDGLADLSDAVGGVTVNNDFEFDAEGIHYPKGKQHLGGWETLQYARMRYEDPLGDYGRQKRQREVTIQLTKELTSMKNVLRYQELLDVIGDNGQTDMTLDQMILLMKNYQQALGDIESYQMQGEGFTGDGYTGDGGISYQRISEEEKQKVTSELKKQLNIN
ncbi:phosphatase PAP2/LCP family protein [Candidatus Enterococcus ikei]|uniref:Phosphatase PAP2/LCP family protein n=1 Tax=Candidatus Enterococcus ikei TaxID=2815326 RepID=A0ABS3GWJ5_9ENTE|nr:phosphatase PAP2/LCP family protein [Enterococcus sp. DIV0869a]MBO0439646.1 phosphatase PAP2/LCP family protein [Enterococcus sp. DIV0869a]